MMRNLKSTMLFGVFSFNIFIMFCYGEGTVKDCSGMKYWHSGPFACSDGRSGYFQCKKNGKVWEEQGYFECPSGKVCWSPRFNKKAEEMCIDPPPTLIDVGFLRSVEKYGSTTLTYRTEKGKWFQFSIYGDDIEEDTYFTYYIPKENGKGFTLYGGSIVDKEKECSKYSVYPDSQHLFGVHTFREFFNMLGSKKTEVNGKTQKWYYELDGPHEGWKTSWTITGTPDETGKFLIPTKFSWDDLYDDRGGPYHDEIRRSYEYRPVDASIEEEYAFSKWCPNPESI